MKQAVRYALIAIGTMALVLGVIGIFVPMLPTTPFLLLAAACYLRSSERMHRWLVEHPKLGCYVRDFVSGKGIPLRGKVLALGLMWITSQASWVIVVNRFGPRAWTVGYAVLLIVVACGVHYYIGYRIPTRETVCDGELDG
jgi:hypothetical protein